MSDFPRWDLILFDLDGTLLDYHSAARRAFEQAFADVGVVCEPHFHEVFGEINRELWRSFEEGGVTARELRVLRYQRLRDQLDLPITAEKFSEHYLELLSQGGDLLPEALETVRELHSSIPLGVITNGFEDVQVGRMAASGLDRYFPHMACSECAGAAKPQRPIFDLAMQQHGLSDPTRVVIVGDNFISDICGGIDYGMAACWYNPYGRERDGDIMPTWEIDRLSLLPELLQD